MPTRSNAIEWTKEMKMEQLPTGLRSGKYCDYDGGVSEDGWKPGSGGSRREWWNRNGEH